MRPEKVSSWRERLPPPFDQLGIIPKRSRSASPLGRHAVIDVGSNVAVETRRHKRSDSGPGAPDQVDRSVNWSRYINEHHALVCHERSASAIQKLKRLESVAASSTTKSMSSGDSINFSTLNRKLSKATISKPPPVHPTHDELLALTNLCFPTMEQSRVVITEYSATSLRTMEYTLEEVLASDSILQPSDSISRVRWIYVEYYKIGTFWGSDYRFAQWGTDPELFEKSPISLLLNRMAELDRLAGRPSLSEEEIPDHKRIGRYYRGTPGCPEFLGLRVNASTWLDSEPYRLLLNYLTARPDSCSRLKNDPNSDLAYGLAYIDAVKAIRDQAYQDKSGLKQVHDIADREGVYVYGSWDDTVERLEFYKEHTLISSGSPRLYKDVADRLTRAEDVLRQHPDCALLYYTLARVSIENDEMMQDGPERALNKVFSRLKGIRQTDRHHVELIFSLQQAVLEGLEYLEENKRELPIWGIPPFATHQVRFHPDHAPSLQIQRLIQDEMDLVDRDFNTIIKHWELLRDKVDRHLDLLLQFRVLDQQELAVSQNHIAVQHQSLAAEEARSARVQSRSVIVFTAITIIFLPLSFFTSYFGMNLTDIIGTKSDSRDFWKIAGPISAGIVLIIFAISKYMSIDNEMDDDGGGGGGGGGLGFGFAKARLPSGQIVGKSEGEGTWRARLLHLRKGKVKIG